jgi:uncharacterized protein
MADLMPGNDLYNLLIAPPLCPNAAAHLCCLACSSIHLLPIGLDMSLSLYDTTVPVFKQMLLALSDVLKKAETQAQERQYDPAVLLQTRLFPNMLPFVRQVQIACDFAKSVPARIAGIEVESYEDSEQTFAELQERIKKTVAVLDTMSAAQFEGGADKQIVLRPGTPKEKTLSGQDYVLRYGLPQFFFHVTTAYDLLRHNGIEIGKKDYMGTY